MTEWDTIITLKSLENNRLQYVTISDYVDCCRPCKNNLNMLTVVLNKPVF